MLSQQVVDRHPVLGAICLHPLTDLCDRSVERLIGMFQRQLLFQEIVANPIELFGV